MTSVYFAASGGRIKIGTTSRSVGTRLRAISHSLPETLELIGRIPGDTRMERAVQQYLAEWNLKGEWFQDCEAIRHKIWEIIADGPDAHGIKPIIPKSETQIGDLPPRERYTVIFPRIAAIVWPDNTLAQLIAFTEYPEGECELWLAGQVKPPRLVRYAFAAVLAMAVADESGSHAASVDFLNQQPENEDQNEEAA